MKKILSLLLIAAMAMAILAGCGSADSKKPAADENTGSEAAEETAPAEGAENEEHSIVIAQSANFAMGFAPDVHSFESTYYMNNFYESLVEYKDGEYVPGLATDWTVSEDGLTYTFNLREGVKFNDGTDFNADAVKLYFDNMKPILGASANYGQLDMLTTEITVDAPLTVSFHLSQPYYNVLNDLSMCMPRGILAAAAFNEDGSLNAEYLLDHTPGTGPYMFGTVNDTATEYTFVKNPCYWGEAPDVDTFTVKIIPESKVAAMRSGDVDFVMGSDTLDAGSYLELAQTEGITGVVSDFDFVTEFIALNSTLAPLSDSAVRTAIQMGIDKSAVAESVYSGLRTPADSVMPAGMPYCDKVSVHTTGYDADTAAKLLEAAGWVDGDGDGIREKDGTSLSFTITYPSTGTYDNVVLYFQSAMAKLGIEIKTDPVDLMAFVQKIFMEQDYEMTAYMSYWFPYDPYTFIANMYPSTDYTNPSGIYSTDPQVAKALAAMSEEEATELISGMYNTDDPAVQDIFTKALDSANESSVVIPLNYRNEYAVFNNSVIDSYTFNAIPNHVDVAGIHLK